MELSEHNLLVISEKFEASVKGLCTTGDVGCKSDGSIAMAINHAHHILKDITGEDGDWSKILFRSAYTHSRGHRFIQKMPLKPLAQADRASFGALPPTPSL